MQTETEAEKKDWMRAFRLTLEYMNEKTQEKKEITKTTTNIRESTVVVYEINGYLLKAGPDGKNYKRRYFVLNKDILLYFKNSEDGSPAGEIPLYDCRIIRGFIFILFFLQIFIFYFLIIFILFLFYFYFVLF